MEDCTMLKWRVHDLIKAGALTFKDEYVPNVNGNPLSDHGRQKINAVESDLEFKVERDVKDVCILIKTVHEALLKASMLDKEQEKKEEKEDREGQYCLYHKRFMGHSI